MIHFLKKWGIVSILFLLIGTSSIGTNNSLKESRLIRRLYLDLLFYPPTPEELDWFLVYNTSNSYEVAVNWILSLPGIIGEDIDKDQYKIYLFSANYKNKLPIKLTPKEVDFLIKYQSGKKQCSIEIASQYFIKYAIQWKGSNPLDVIDYMALCLMAEETTVEEANKLLGIFRKYPVENEGYLAVLEELKKNDKVIYK